MRRTGAGAPELAQVQVRERAGIRHRRVHRPAGSRQGFGALLLGYYDADGRLTYAGKVGTGFDDRMLRQLHAALTQLEQPQPPFERGTWPSREVHWVQPRLVGQVAFTERAAPSSPVPGPAAGQGRRRGRQGGAGKLAPKD
jgi:ATP-dependent DNA ligase